VKTFLFVVLISTLLNSSIPFDFSSNKSVKDEPENMKGMIDQHNVWRAKVGVSSLKWSDELASYAQVWANHLAEKGCEMQHRPRSGEFTQKYGENIYWCSGMKATPQAVVDSWASELADFNVKKLECNKGKVCGHYTQVIWSSTLEVGCAMARCGNQEIWVCNYNPPGNWVGQKPYSPKK
jgi:pathogenesis-related protein 1